MAHAVAPKEFEAESVNPKAHRRRRRLFGKLMLILPTASDDE
jgi:hypothetical protein